MDDTAELLRQERQNASFDVNEFADLFDESAEFTKAKRDMALLIERDPILVQKNFYDLSRTEERTKVMAMIRRAVEIKKSLKDPLQVRAFVYWIDRYDKAFSMKVYVHEGLFRESIFTQGTEEQWNHWKDAISDWKVIGCFAMTELGHSSFLRGIETTATYDKQTQEFVINTTALTGTKWWIGAAGQTATHTVALSKLIVNGKDCGIHWFIVPLRCPNTGRLLPGITAGDIGAKVARNGLDNGWIQFSSVRVPRQNMLMKWAQVSQDGVFTPPENPAISYNTLITERLLALNLMVECLAPAMIISIRYGVMRQQGPNNERIMDYQSHQWNLIPILASTFAMTVLFDKLRGDWNQALQAQHDKKQFLGIVQYWHGVSSGLKAWQGWWTMDALEIVRRSLGGHAYSSYSGMGTLITDFAVTTTGAGDNYTLSQQSAKWLLSIAMKQVKGGRKPYGYTAFLGDSKFYSPLNYSDTSIQDSFRWLCTRVIESGARKFTNVRSEKEFDKVWDANMMELIPASRLFSTIVMQETFSEFIKNAEKKASKPVVQVLEKLNQVLLLSHLLKESGLFLEYDYITGKDIRQAREKFSALCADLRTEAAALVDTLRYPDFVVNSVLGRSDGNLYQHYFNTVVNAPNSLGVPSYFEESIAPLTRSKL